ncbi:MAG: hypothetical protein Sapg2KO_02020 [Saprospiraceae bacterium]
MLSILLPIYNFDVRPLVQELWEQGRSLSVPFEIVALDDGSASDFKALHQDLDTKAEIRYQELPENLGRSAIRNELARMARYEFLLYIDCDSKVVRMDYLQYYIDHLHENALLYGGRTYQESAPSDPDLHLHWAFGTAREVTSPYQRRQRPYHGFMTNNFVVPKSIQKQFPFEEKLRQYGHEDTLFGLQLSKAKVPIIHLDNALEHIGLETAEIFLEKSRQAIHNLAYLAKNYPEIDTRLLAMARRMQKVKMGGFYAWFHRKMAASWEEKLTSRQPDLRLFDLWKLGLFLNAFDQ